MALNVPRLHGPNDDYKADRGFIGERGKNMNRKDKASFRFGRGHDLWFVSAEPAGYRKRLEGTSESI